MLDDKFGNEEDFFRAIRPGSMFWDEERNRPTSGAFKDSRGLSVDRDGGRVHADVIEAILRKMSDVKAVASISYKGCSDIGVYAKYLPIEGNEFHSEIHESSIIVKISNAKAKRLSDLVSLVIY